MSRLPPRSWALTNDGKVSHIPVLDTPMAKTYTSLCGMEMDERRTEAEQNNLAAYPPCKQCAHITSRELTKRAQELPEKIGQSLDDYGGLLRCEQCLLVIQMNLGDAGHFIAEGWPTHCKETMRWWTRRQIDAGEMP